MKCWSRILFPVLLFSFPLPAEKNYFYTVYFWKIPCVNITMTLSEDRENSQNQLTFITRTNDLFSYIFSLDNSYKTRFDPDSFQMLQYEKTIRQSNFDQDITISWDSTEQAYQYQKIVYHHPANTHNIFSLLMRAQSMDWQALDTQWWFLDHEGAFYRSRFLWIDSTEVDVDHETFMTDHYRIDLIERLEENQHLVDTTDIFTWGITLENCVRQIWIERGGERRILRAEVKVRGFTLVAELKNG